MKTEKGKLTFQHFDGHLGDSVRLLFVEAERFAHHHLTEAAFAQRLPQNQSVELKHIRRPLNTHAAPTSFKKGKKTSAGSLGHVPVPGQLPAGVLGQLVLRHPRQHRRAAGGEAGRADQHHSGVDGGAGVHGHLRSNTLTLLLSQWNTQLPPTSGPGRNVCSEVNDHRLMSLYRKLF